MKAGVDYIYQNRLQRNLYQQFTFSDSSTINHQCLEHTGNSLASALLGLPATFTAQTPEQCRRLLQHAVVVWLRAGHLEGDPKLR